MAPVGRADAGHHLALFEFIDLQFNGPFGSTEFFSHCGNGDFWRIEHQIDDRLCGFPRSFPRSFFRWGSFHDLGRERKGKPQSARFLLDYGFGKPGFGAGYKDAFDTTAPCFDLTSTRENVGDIRMKGL